MGPRHTRRMLARLRDALRSWSGPEARRLLKWRVRALWKLMKHPSTPWTSRAVAALVLLYALSPIDLIPDFIPVLGMLDELILLPLGLALAVAMAPRPLWQDCLDEAAREVAEGRPRPPRWWLGGALIVVIWLALAGWAGWALLRGWVGSPSP